MTTDRPCHADDLTAVLPEWTTKTLEVGERATPEEERAARRAGPLGLSGQVTATNISSRACVLRGETTARLLVDGRPAPVESSSAINEEAENRKTQVGPGQRADLRLDWSPPYCAATGRQTLELGLPHGGGTLTVPVTRPSTPPCSHSEIHPELRTYLSTSAWDEPAVTTEPVYALAPLTVTRVSPDRVTVPVGGTVEYVIRLTNPTGSPLSLTGAVYLQELFAQGDATREAVNESTGYRLNTRPVPVLAPGQSQDFRFRLVLPPALTAGRDLSVSWRLRGPMVPGEDRFATAITVTAR